MSVTLTNFTLLACAAFVSLSVPAVAQRIPIQDGAYLADEASCEELRTGELDFVDFEVSEAGMAVALPEAFCVVADVKSVRESRYRVTADCDEFGDLSQYTFFLDVISKEEIAIDGSPHRLCRLDASHEEVSSLTWSDEVEELIERWALENEDCRGGSGDDPKTMTACDRRTAVSKALDDLDICYGRESDEATAAYEWHRCEAGSIRFE